MPSKTNQKYDNRPVGVFDSGVGGLTVVRELMKTLPNEQIIYFGDTARIPYGSKSEETVRRFSLEDSFFLLDKDVKIVVVACNTASSVATNMLSDLLEVPVTGVIQPGAHAAAVRSSNKKIGVIGTAGTVRSGSYRRELLTIESNAHIISQACPLFVPLVEEGWIEDEATYLIARRYLQPLLENEIDTLILGCTHYPLLKSVLQKIVGPHVHLIDSGVETAMVVGQMLEKLSMFAAKERIPEHRFYLSDMPYKFQEIAERFLERSIPHVHTVNFDNFLIEKGRKFWEKYQDEVAKVY